MQARHLRPGMRRFPNDKTGTCLTRNLLLISLALVLAGCVSPPGRRAGNEQANTPAALQQRATNRFASAFLIKPVDADSGPLHVQLAPLLMMETSQLRASPHSAATSAQVQRVYYLADTVQIRGKLHARFAYVWLAPAKEHGKTASPDQWQGVRITLDSAGRPSVWEGLADSSGERLLFVADSLEQAAKIQFGLPEAGRVFAVERSVEQSPRTMVPRTVEDGPAPMGPFVYTTAQLQDVGAGLRGQPLVPRTIFDCTMKSEGSRRVRGRSWGRQS